MLVFAACTSSIQTDKSLSVRRDSLAVLSSWNVTTVISDSGITRFRVTTPEWLVYDRLPQPCWRFNCGLHLEKFNELLEVEAEVDADTAVYFSNEERWVLSGHVHAMNLNKETFETERLYVDQTADRIHTPCFVTITQKNRIIHGMGLESNQSLSKYAIINPTGVIPVDDDDAGSTK